MAIAETMLLGSKESQRLNQVEVFLRAGHRDIQQATFLVDLRRLSGGHVRRNAPVDQVQHIDRVPFLTLGRMDCRQDKIIFVELRTPGVCATCVGRFERQLGQKAFTAGMAGSDLLQLFEVAGAYRCVIIKPFEVRLISKTVHAAEMLA